MNHQDYFKKDGKFMAFLHDVIIVFIKVLAVLTVVVIAFGVLNSLWTVFINLRDNNFILNISSFFNIFSQLLIVLIAVEIFQNIAMYIRTDVIPIRLVLATALIAVARKFIIIESSKEDVYYIIAMSVAVLALSFSYWLLGKKRELSVLAEEEKLD